MDIGPVNPIRSVQAVRPSPPGSADGSEDWNLAGVFATELREHQREESSYSSRKQSRGLEDDEEEAGEEIGEPEPSDEAPGAAPPRSINFFA